MRAAALGMVLLCLVSGCTKSGTNSIGIVLIKIPAGKFTMGDLASEEVAVTLTKPFWLGKTEVTQGQWKQVMGTAPWKDGGYAWADWTDKDCPAICVSWMEAKTFCQKLTDLKRKAGKLPAGESYRLPTEAEWEYACRAGTTTEWSFGNEEEQLDEYAWFVDSDPWGAGGPSFFSFARWLDGSAGSFARKVGMKKPNPWGLYDMHGNVFEWCSDWYGEKLLGGADPVGPGGGSDRVLRGGSWWDDPILCRSACRDLYDPSPRSNDLGFRVARSQSAQ